ncbi:MAG: NosD domain-containing protein [Candidatus Thorarchaeota archaeon]
MKAKKNCGILLALTLLTFAVCVSSLLLIIENIDFRNDKPFNDFNDNKLEISSYLELGPVFIDGSAGGVGAHNWTWVESQSWFGGGDGSSSNPYIIENIEIDGGGVGNCFEIISSDVYFVIRNCNFYNSGTEGYNAGLRLSYASNGVITDSIFSNNGYNGIYMSDCANNTISGNKMNKNTYFREDTSQQLGHGILLSKSNNNTILENTMSFNAYAGICLRIYSNYNDILYNEGYKNIDRGLFLEASSYNNIIGNKFCGSILNYNELGGDGNNLEDNTFECESPKPGIPGYSLFIIGLIIAISMILIKKKLK